MPEIIFVTLKVISGYKTKTYTKNNYSETKEPLLLASTWNGQLPTDNCRVREKEIHFTSHLLAGEGATIGSYFKICL